MKILVWMRNNMHWLVLGTLLFTAITLSRIEHTRTEAYRLAAEQSQERMERAEEVEGQNARVLRRLATVLEGMDTSRSDAELVRGMYCADLAAIMVALDIDPVEVRSGIDCPPIEPMTREHPDG